MINLPKPWEIAGRAAGASRQRDDVLPATDIADRIPMPRPRTPGRTAERLGIVRDMTLRRRADKPFETRARNKAEAMRRTRMLLCKRMEREGY